MENETAPTVRYAGFWIRTVAFVIDLILLNFLSWFLELATVGAAYWGMRLAGRTFPPGQGFEAVFDPFFLQIVSTAIFLALTVLYFVGVQVEYGATLGKRIFRIKVVRMDTLETMSWMQAVARWFGYGASCLAMGAGYLMAAIQPRKRALHDLLAGTVVIISDPQDK